MALALTLELPVWSQDKDLSDSALTVFTTGELLGGLREAGHLDQRCSGCVLTSGGASRTTSRPPARKRVLKNTLFTGFAYLHERAIVAIGPKLHWVVGYPVMRSLVYRPSSSPPVSNRDLTLYADKWVVVRAGKVILQAGTFDELAAKRKSGVFKDGDKMLRLPPRPEGITTVH